MKTTVVIPAYNEEKTIGKVIDDIRKYVDEIIVVDDASTDDTAIIAEKNLATVVKHQKNQGYDKTIDDGFQKAAKSKPDIIFTFDADGQHMPNDIPKILNPIKNNEADVVVGIRPKKQHLSEKIFANFSKKKIGVSDPLCGIKAYSAKSYNKIGYFDKLESIGTELMLNCHKQGFKIQEVKIGMNKRADKPRFGNAFKSNFKILRAYFRIKNKFR